MILEVKSLTVPEDERPTWHQFRSATSPVDRPLRVFLWLSFFLGTISLLSVWWRWTHGHVNALDSLFMPDMGFDYDDYAGRFLYRHSARFFTLPGYPWYYPAPAFFVLYPFYRWCHSPWEGYASYIVVAGFLSLGIAVLFGYSLSRRGLRLIKAYGFALAALLLSWPLYFAVQRGNIEVLTWPLLALAVWLWVHERPKTAAVFLGVVGSIKLYPLLFVVLFLKRRQWSSVAIAGSVTVVVTVAALWFLDPNLRESLTFVHRGVAQWTQDYSEVSRGSEMDHSLFGLFKTFYRHHPYHKALRVYYLLAGSLFITWLLRSRMPAFNTITVLTLAAITLPSTSFDYTLCALYIPFGMLSVSSVQARTKGQTLGMALFAAALSPLAFLFYGGNGLAGPTRAVVLIGLFGWSLWYKPLSTTMVGPQSLLRPKDPAQVPVIST